MSQNQINFVLFVKGMYLKMPNTVGPVIDVLTILIIIGK